MIFGRHHKPDARDQLHRIKRRASQRTSRYWGDHYWRGDQANTPQCVGYAWAHLLACAPIVQRLNPTGIYTFAQFLDEWAGEDYQGTSVRAGAKALHHMGVIGGYQWAWSEPTIRNHILEVGPVVMGTNWYEGMSNPDANGVVAPVGALEGGHAYTFTGYNDATGFYRGLQSWGPAWSALGCHFKIHRKHVAKLVREDGEACCPTEVNLRRAA